LTYLTKNVYCLMESVICNLDRSLIISGVRLSQSTIQMRVKEVKLHYIIRRKS